MIEPGWYVDDENPKQLRYHDGSAWTEHIHTQHINTDHVNTDHMNTELPTAPAPARATPPMPPSSTEHNSPVSTTGARSAPTSTDLISICVLGVFVGLMFGGFLFNGLGAITPVTDYAGTVERIEIEYSTASSNSGTGRRASYVLSGSTADSADWRIVNEEAYRVLEAEGYPQDVVVSIGAWTNSAERVVGDSFIVDHQSTGARIGWAVALAVIGLSALVATVLIGRSRSGGAIKAAVFLVSFFGPGSWLGYQLFQWFQSA